LDIEKIAVLGVDRQRKQAHSLYMINADLTKQTPAEIDAALAAFHEEAAPHFSRASAAAKRASERWQVPYRGASPATCEAHKARHEAECAAARIETKTYAALGWEVLAKGAPQEAEFKRRGGWSRFFKCEHIHSSMHCHTLHVTSRRFWIPEMSGKTEAEAVAAYGETMCTVCFPSAPTMTGWAESVAARLAEKAAKFCKGSGTRDSKPSKYSRCYSPKDICNACGQLASVTSTGKLRNHKVAQKAVA
jgi:hypothetical protein